MTDIEICQRDVLYQTGRWYQASRGFAGRSAVCPGLAEDTTMAIEIFYLTTQIQRWINERVARHLAAQAAKLTH
jgi:hypothetical protein